MHSIYLPRSPLGGEEIKETGNTGSGTRDVYSVSSEGDQFGAALTDSRYPKRRLDEKPNIALHTEADAAIRS
jgi:hypothetical protein